jgi:hypothetical protein
LVRDESKHPEASFEADPATQPDDENSSQIFDDVDRRGFLRCMAWGGNGLIWSFAGGVPVSTAFPQPAPGTAPSPGPMKVPADKLRDVLGIAEVNFVSKHQHLATVDTALSGAAVEVHEGQPA